MAKATARLKARRRRPDALAITVALERARLKRMIQAKRDIARLVNELRRVDERSYEITQSWAFDLLAARGYEVVPRGVAHDTGKPDDSAGEK